MGRIDKRKEIKMSGNDKRIQYENNMSKAIGATVECPMCKNDFQKKRKQQGCCQKDPCGMAYTKLYRNTNDGLTNRHAPFVHQIKWPIVKEFTTLRNR